MSPEERKLLFYQIAMLTGMAIISFLLTLHFLR